MNLDHLFLKMMNYYYGDSKQIQHFTKVHSFARLIGIEENLDQTTQEILEIAAIVHDIGIKPAIEKYGSGMGKYQEQEGPAFAREMLEELNYPPHIIDRVCYLVGHHHTYTNIDGMDYQILVEADFLVNMHENQSTKKSIEATLNKIFRTKAGSNICKVMFGIE